VALFAAVATVVVGAGLLGYDTNLTGTACH
jgi:hypothetical protein